MRPNALHKIRMNKLGASNQPVAVFLPQIDTFASIVTISACSREEQPFDGDQLIIAFPDLVNVMEPQLADQLIAPR